MFQEVLSKFPALSLAALSAVRIWRFLQAVCSGTIIACYLRHAARSYAKRHLALHLVSKHHGRNFCLCREDPRHSWQPIRISSCSLRIIFKKAVRGFFHIKPHKFAIYTNIADFLNCKRMMNANFKHDKHIVHDTLSQKEGSKNYAIWRVD